MRTPSTRSFSLLAALALSYVPATHAQSLTSAQIKQIEEIAQTIASQHNANSKAMLDDMTVSSRAVAIGRNVRFEFVLRVKKGLPPAKLKEFSDGTRGEIVPKSCAANANNPAFDRGLYYTFAYVNIRQFDLSLAVPSKSRFGHGARELRRVRLILLGVTCAGRAVSAMTNGLRGIARASH